MFTIFHTKKEPQTNNIYGSTHITFFKKKLKKSLITLDLCVTLCYNIFIERRWHNVRRQRKNKRVFISRYTSTNDTWNDKNSPRVKPRQLGDNSPL